jgi:hypothetical protein
LRPAQTDPVHVGVLASSNAAASSSPIEPTKARADEPAAANDRGPTRSPARAEPRTLLEVIWAAPELAPKLRAHAPWRPLFEAEGRDHPAPGDDRSNGEKRTNQAKEPSSSKGAAGAADADRATLATVLGRATPTTDVESAMWSSANAEGVLGASLVLVAGELELMFDEVRTLEATVAAASPLASAEKRLKETIDSNAELAKSPLATAPGLAAGLTQRIREAWSKANRSLPADALDTSARAILLDQRAYQRRPLWGASFVRALLAGGESARVPVYLPDEVGGQLPLVHRLHVRAIAEALPQQDPSEAHPVALRVLALARVVSPKRRGS